jgi:hypothetical protein
MSQLLAIALGYANGPQVAEKLGLRDSPATADHWLATRPGAYRSSVSSKVMAGRRGQLTLIERRLLGEVHYQLSDQS